MWNDVDLNYSVLLRGSFGVYCLIFAVYESVFRMCDSHWQPDCKFIYPTTVRQGKTMRSSCYYANISCLIWRGFFSCLQKNLRASLWRSDNTGFCSHYKQTNKLKVDKGGRKKASGSKVYPGVQTVQSQKKLMRVFGQNLTSLLRTPAANYEREGRVEGLGDSFFFSFLFLSQRVEWLCNSQAGVKERLERLHHKSYSSHHEKACRHAQSGAETCCFDNLFPSSPHLRLITSPRGTDTIWVSSDAAVFVNFKPVSRQFRGLIFFWSWAFSISRFLLIFLGFLNSRGDGSAGCGTFRTYTD